MPATTGPPIVVASSPSRVASRPPGGVVVFTVTAGRQPGAVGVGLRQPVRPEQCRR